MNNTKGKVLTIIGLGGVVLTGVGVFATTSTGSFMSFNKRPQMMKELGTGDFKDFKNPQGEGMPCERGNAIVGKFIDEENLSDAEKEELKVIEEKKQEAMQTLQEKNQEAMKEINDEYFASIKKFVAEDKLEEFESFVEQSENFEPGMRGFGHEKGMMGGMPEMNGERPEMPEMNGERPERPERGTMQRNLQGTQEQVK